MNRTVLLNSLLLFFFPSFSGQAQVVVLVENDLDAVRTGETIEIRASELLRLLPTSDPKRFHVADEQGNRLLVQPVDLAGDGIIEQLIFQADFQPREVRQFTITLGEPQQLTREQFKAYGRFVRERFDDFAWENDRVAHRMYGPALETWQREPLTSSAVDIWCKRVRRLVINYWHMVDDYHTDTGEGADFYSAGKSRGCGGSGIWVDNKLHPSRNFMSSRVLANGPIRVVFELDYGAWVVKGQRIAETKRITLDAGQNLSRFESRYLRASLGDLTVGVGIKKSAGSTVKVKTGEGWLRTWEPVKGNGNVGCGIVADPASIVDSVEDDLNYLLLLRSPDGFSVSYL